MTGVEAEAGVDGIAKAGDDEAGSGEQHERQGDFNDDDDAAGTIRGAAGGGSAGGILHGAAGLGVCGFPYGGKSEENRGEQSGGEGEKENSAIDGDGGDGGNAEIGDVVGKETEEGAGSGKSEQDSGNASEEAEEEALGHELADEMHARSAESEADGDFLLALGFAGQREASCVGAGDEENQAGGAEEDEERHANVAIELLAERSDDNTVALVGVRMGEGDLGFEIVESLLCGFRGDAGFEAGEDAHVAALEVVGRGGSHRRWHPDLGLGRVVEGGWHDAEDGVGLAVEGDGFADDGAVRVEGSAPEMIAEEGDGRTAGAIFLIGVEAAELRGDAENAEITGGDSVADEELRRALAGEGDFVIPGGRHVFDDPALLFPEGEVAWTTGQWIAPACGVGGPDRDDAA